ncbi:MAG TPA: DUF3040 domain-containing protein [Pseudonocardiaceae bacterium]|jgi:hypothetical protein|nr:DUF3040 domain-containing protein [Pseudonocardiaceae bacterium]
MPLSEHEQRLLEQIERALYAEDPKFASNVRGARLRSPSRRRRLQGIAVFVLGLVLLVVGAAVMRLWVAGVPVVSVLGFLVMFAGAAVAILARGGGGRDTAAGERSGQPPPGGAKSGLAQRMEERFRRRFEER